MATTLQKYLFDMDFDAPEKPAVEDMSMFEGMDDEDLLLPEPIDELPPPPPPPTFSEEDLQLARDQAYESGRTAGILESETASARMLANAMALLTNAMQQILTVQAQANENRLRDAVAVSVMVLKKMLPEMTRRHALDEIEGVVHEALAQLDQDIRVTIRVSPTQLEAVREHAERAAEACGFEGKLIFSPDSRFTISSRDSQAR